jgi:hypothetical protein
MTRRIEHGGSGSGGSPRKRQDWQVLRKGKGSLYKNVEQIVKDLTEEGTIKSGAQPVVIIVQEIPSPPWAMDDDDD